MTTTKRCPICRKPRVEAHSPFCSQRCKDRDLAQWFNDGYSVPGPPVSPDELAVEDRGD
uniref:DNA gyrase inhibitor YacG n=1 Tax=Parerythrobacter lutipelagi TaxID=1964208 RepID=UPI0010F9D311|nr:DNA gyrase inhibitor YacG [Parerythrobacter lutipelagi]